MSTDAEHRRLPNICACPLYSSNAVPPTAIINEYNALGGPSFNEKAFADVMVMQVQTLVDEIEFGTNGKDHSGSEAHAKFTVVANVSGFRNTAFLNKWPRFYSVAVEQMESDRFFAAWSFGFMSTALFVGLPGWNNGNGDAWIAMEMQRTQYLTGQLLQNADRIRQIQYLYPTINNYCNNPNSNGSP